MVRFDYIMNLFHLNKRLTSYAFYIAIFSFMSNSYAASPPNLTTDIPWLNSAYGGVADIEAAFNHARRQEEIQLGTAPNTINDLNLPSNAIWSAMSVDEKSLYLINDERTARAGMLPGVIGLPLAGIEQHIDSIAENYANVLHDTDTFGHYQPGGFGVDGPAKRIEQHPVIGSLHASSITYSAGSNPQHSNNSTHYYGDTHQNQGACHEFISRTENLATFTAYSSAPLDHTSIPLPVERAIYAFIYDDSSSAWGHREAALLQDESLGNPTAGWGFNNNHASAAHEGYLGVHLIGSSSYQPFGPPPLPYSYGVVIVMNIFDPVSDAQQATLGCNYIDTSQTPTRTELNLISSCLGGNGRIDLNIVNTVTASSVYRLEFEGLSARERAVAFEDWGRIAITGRLPGTYSAVVKRDDVTVLDSPVTINCSDPQPPVSSPEVTIVNACRSDLGQVFFQLVNPTATSRPYIIEFQNVSNRSTTAAPFGQSIRGTTGRPNGTYAYTVRTGSTIVDDGQVTVDCN